MGGWPVMAALLNQPSRTDRIDIGRSVTLSAKKPTLSSLSGERMNDGSAGHLVSWLWWVDRGGQPRSLAAMVATCLP